MFASLSIRMLREVSFRCLWSFAYRFGWQGMWAVRRFQQSLARGGNFPAFMFISITNRCNLRCQGCWVDVSGADSTLSAAELEKIIGESRAAGIRFFGILGGEPLLYPDLYSILAKFPDCYFQVFTNGTLVTSEAADKMARLGNITPLISIEGGEVVSDERRGGEKVFSRSIDGVKRCREAGLVTGVATSVCKSNRQELASEAFLDQLISLGVHYAWYYIYRPVGADPTPELALSSEEIIELRRFIVEMRCRKSIAVVDSYWDHLGRAVCPAATGIAWHINPAGAVEPCPPIQFAADNVLTDAPLYDVIERSAFLRSFRDKIAAHGRGCVLLDDPELLAEVAKKNGAEATSGRDGFAELANAPVLPSHHQPGKEIPEKSWMYRFAKKHWFFGFGAYG